MEPTSPGQSELSPDGFTPAQFQVARKRHDLPGGLLTPIRGFGPGGGFTLFVPSPEPDVAIVFEDGEPVRRVAEGCLADPKIAALRDCVIASMRNVGAGKMEIDFRFLSYTAAVLKLAYNLTDADLGFLLRGKAWHREMVAHALGGAGIIGALSAMAHPTPAAPPHNPQPIADVLAAVRSDAGLFEARQTPSLWRRILRPLIRR
jgi:hypothetical protein